MNGAGAPRESEVSSAMNRLSKSVEDMGKALETFLSRIAPVCRPSSPMKTEGGNIAVPEGTVSAPLAAQVYAEGTRMFGFSARLNEVLSRLEL